MLRLNALRHSRVRLVLALLALLLRAVMPDAALAQSPDGDFPICHVGDDGAGDRAPAGSKHDCTLCPACQMAHVQAALLPSVAIIRVDSPVRLAGVAWCPPATGPPQHDRYAAPPRGPPALSV